ncbi:hypothetical protein [Candidatus Pantoea multigeneris]|uniref:Uncharacterized protein n=1 Tax=Candidatus Pantoea multigeneris TaxID=2608357 RepID=A0ABX0RA17_9GAMM|nr:hypothetical protein [Pantoea multigeneris]NIF21328.1 hypothetical protein [Pantoea multigeneris]
MTIELFIEFFIEAKSTQGKEKIFKKIHKNLIGRHGPATVIPLSESKFIVSIEVDEWETCIFKVISYSQEIGRQWILTGNIEHECNLWTNHSKIVGVNSISISADCMGKEG